MATHLLFLIFAALVASVFAVQDNQLAFPYIKAIAFARLDPIVFPGQVSGHVHKFVGASKVSDVADFDSLQESQCTTHPVSVDKSSYWMPTFYHNGSDGFTLLNDIGRNIIYYGMAGDVQAFPDNFRMVAGSPTEECHEGPDRYFVCIKDNDVKLSYHIPQTECDIIGGHIAFPSCWSGKDFTLETQNNELVNPTEGSLGANCPSTHPVKLPSLMMDLWVNASGLAVNPDGPTYALSFGDTIGCGLHADFLNGWNRDVLQAAMTECKDFNGDMDPSTCKPLAPYYNHTLADECVFESPVPDEDIGLTGPIPKLVYCSPDESDEACTKQDVGVKFVSETKMIDVLGIRLPIAVAELDPSSASSSRPSSETPKSSSKSSESHRSKTTSHSSPSSSSTHKTSPTSTQRMVTSSRPRPTSSAPRPSGTSGSPPPKNPVGPIHRPPPGSEEGGGGDDDC